MNRYDFKSGSIYKTYNRLITPFLESRKKSFVLLGGIVLALFGCVGLLLLNAIPLKMLPFDNKNDFLIVLRTPEGTTLEETYACVADMERYLATVNEVANVESYVGVPAPIDFNGLVRHYYLLEGDNQAQIRINLADKKDRVYQSHAVALETQARHRQNCSFPQSHCQDCGGPARAAGFSLPLWRRSILLRRPLMPV